MDSSATVLRSCSPAARTTRQRIRPASWRSPSSFPVTFPRPDDGMGVAGLKGQQHCRDFGPASQLQPLVRRLTRPICGRNHPKMFAFFERFLTPTAAPENPEPPDSLVAFLWHFARQAKWLFAALFVVEMLVALADSSVPWFMGRVVDMVTKMSPERFFA